MNVFQFSAAVQAMWEHNVLESFNSYVPNSTWAGDLAITMWCDKFNLDKNDPIRNTIVNGINEWKNEEGHHYLIMLGCAINFMSWFCAANEKWEAYGEKFSNLYYWYIDQMDEIDPEIYGQIHYYLD